MDSWEQYLQDLNEEQQGAVQTTEGPVLIIAGAGTGKTKSLTHRIAYIIAKGLAKPEEILALTFTEKASQEMRARVELTLPYGKSGVDVCTFHAFGDYFLKENAISIGLTPDYKVMNTPEEIYFFKEHLFAFPLSYYRPISNPSKFIEALLSYFSRLKDEDVDITSYRQFIHSLQDDINQGKSGEFDSIKTLQEYISIQEELCNTYEQYELLKKEQGILNFSDLVFLTLDVLRNKSTIREYYQKKYKYILVDEYQDTNYAQNEIVTILSQRHKNLCVCGDDDQSIYRFRGASISNILQFEEHYPDCKKIVLTQNYRSSQTILDSAYRLINNNNPDRLEIIAKVDKRLKAVGNKSSYPVISHESENVTKQMEYLIEQIQLIMGENTSLHYSDFAVLIRSNSQAQQIIRQCNISDIPFKYEGNTGLYETKEIRILLSFLYSLARYDDNISIFHLAASPLYDLQMDLLSACNSLAKGNSKPLSYIFHHIDSYTHELELSDENLEKIHTLIADIQAYQERSRNENVGSILLAYIKEKGFLELLDNEKGRIENVQKFFQRIDRFITNTTYTSVDQFCDFLDYSREMGDDPSSEETDTSIDAVNIMTIHKAKGMEFHTVFMIDLIEGRFPVRDMRDPIEIPTALVKEILPEGNFHIQEERRLFYVGMTRAKDRLFLLWAKDYYQKTLKKPSPFVKESTTQSLTSTTKEKTEKIIKDEIDEVVEETIILTLTQSQMDEYALCPLKYDYMYRKKLQGIMQFHATLGSLMHDIVEQVLMREMQKNPVFLDEIMTSLNDKWSDKGYLSQGHIDQAYSHVKQMITKFLEESKTFKPKFIEKKFQVPFTSKTIIQGRWDLIDASGKIVDFKTSVVHNSKEAIAKAKESPQLKIYAWAYEKTFHELPTKLSLYFLSSSIEEGYVPDAKTIRDAEKIIQYAVNGIRSNRFEANPSYLACTYCQFNKICEFTQAN